MFMETETWLVSKSEATVLMSPLGFPGSSAVKNPLAMQETPVQFRGWQDTVEKGRALHSSILGLP